MRRLFSKRAVLSEIESRVLKDIKGALPLHLSSIFSLQISKIDRIQRLDRGREVDFYYALPDSSIPLLEDFSNMDEHKLANVHLQSNNSGHQVNARVWLVRGRLFSVEFNAPPGDLRNEAITSDVFLHLETNG